MIQQLCLQRYSVRGLIALDTLNNLKKILKRKIIADLQMGLVSARRTSINTN